MIQIWIYVAEAIEVLFFVKLIASSNQKECDKNDLKRTDEKAT